MKKHRNTFELDRNRKLITLMENYNRANLKSRVTKMIKIQSSVRRTKRIICAFFKRFLNANRDRALSFSTFQTRSGDPRNGNQPRKK